MFTQDTVYILTATLSTTNIEALASLTRESQHPILCTIELAKEPPRTQEQLNREVLKICKQYEKKVKKKLEKRLRILNLIPN